jgi:hypothetical protein
MQGGKRLGGGVIGWEAAEGMTDSTTAASDSTKAEPAAGGASGPSLCEGISVFRSANFYLPLIGVKP